MEEDSIMCRICYSAGWLFEYPVKKKKGGKNNGC
jgi:hypothetical protein